MVLWETVFIWISLFGSLWAGACSWGFNCCIYSICTVWDRHFLLKYIVLYISKHIFIPPYATVHYWLKYWYKKAYTGLFCLKCIFLNVCVYVLDFTFMLYLHLHAFLIKNISQTNSETWILVLQKNTFRIQIPECIYLVS